MLKELEERLANTSWLADQIRGHESEASLADILRATKRLRVETDATEGDALAQIFPDIIDRIDAKRDRLSGLSIELRAIALGRLTILRSISV